MAEQAKLLEQELALWPGVEWHFDYSSRHPRIYVSYNGASRFLPFTSTNTDPRGMRNKISQLRRELQKIGASKG